MILRAGSHASIIACRRRLFLFRRASAVCRHCSNQGFQPCTADVRSTEDKGDKPTQLSERPLAARCQLADQLSGKADHCYTAHEELVFLGEAELVADAKELAGVADGTDAWALQGPCSKQSRDSPLLGTMKTRLILIESHTPNTDLKRGSKDNEVVKMYAPYGLTGDRGFLGCNHARCNGTYG